LTEELPFVGSGEHPALARASAMTENVIVFRYVEVAARQHRLISVMKMRESDYDSSIREFVISSQGIDIGTRYHLRDQTFLPMDVDPAPLGSAVEVPQKKPRKNVKGATVGRSK